MCPVRPLARLTFLLQVRDRLVAACQALGVKFVYNASVEQITPPAAPGDQQQPEQQQHQHLPAAGSNTRRPGSTQWRVGLASGESVMADRVVVSTGGYSFPAVGTDGTGLRLLCALGHQLSVGQCYAALTPLKGPHPGGEQLAGGMTQSRVCTDQERVLRAQLYTKYMRKQSQVSSRCNVCRYVTDTVFCSECGCPCQVIQDLSCVSVCRSYPCGCATECAQARQQQGAGCSAARWSAVHSQGKG